MINVGFTGTREGMTWKQRETLETLLRERLHRIEQVHHGCCIGADVQFHDLVRQLAAPIERPITIVGHPATTMMLQASCLTDDCDVLMPVRPPLARNKDIVAHCHILIAAPAQGVMVMRSGTWSTVRHAVRKNVKVCIITPGGLCRNRP